MDAHRTPMLFIPLVVLAVGCAGPEGAVPSPISQPGIEPVVLVQQSHAEGEFEFDVLCLTGGVGPLDRERGARVDNVTALDVAIVLAPTITGMQVGYSVDSVDEQAVIWLPTVAPPGAEQEIPVSPDQWEGPTGAQRWTFHYRMNVKEAEQDCYTGGGPGAYELAIATRPGSGS